MQLHYTGNIEILPALKTHTEAKLNHLAEKFQHITNVYIIFTVEKNEHIAEAVVHINGKEIDASATSHDMYESVNAMAEKLSTQLTKYKEKLTDHH